MTITLNSGLVSQSLGDRFSEDNSNVLDCVMAVHLEISCDFEFQIKKAVSCKAGKHMVEKADARIDLILATSVQTQFQGNIRLPGLSIYNRSSLHDLFLVLLLKTNRDGIGVSRQLFCLRKADDILVYGFQGLLGIINDAGTLDEIIHT